MCLSDSWNEEFYRLPLEKRRSVLDPRLKIVSGVDALNDADTGDFGSDALLSDGIFESI